MAQQFRTEVSLLDKLLLILHFLRVLTAVIWRLFTIPFDKEKPKSAVKELIYAGLRSNLTHINVAQEQYIAGTTQDAYLEVAGKQKFQPETTVLSSGLRLHWLGPKTSEKVVVFLHGGGYALPAAPGNVKWLLDLQKEISKKTTVSIILVDYSLTPKAQFPEQLQQAAEALYWLVEKQGKRPADIALAGDSAGGNLTLALLSHILHPHPEATKIELREPLATVVLISPWVKFSSEDWSWRKNANYDMLTPRAIARWSSMFIGSSTVNEYMEPIRGDVTWWSGLDRIVKDVLVWGGKSEVLIDSIDKISWNLKEAHPKVELVIQPRAAHDDPIMEAVLEFEQKHEGTKVIESWLTERL